MSLIPPWTMMTKEAVLSMMPPHLVCMNWRASQRQSKMALSPSLLILLKAVEGRWAKGSSRLSHIRGFAFCVTTCGNRQSSWTVTPTLCKF